MSDGKVVIETDLDSSGVESGLSRLQGTITKGIAAIGIGKLFSEAVKTGMDFEAQMSRVKAISGATGEEFAKLKEQAKQLGADTAFSATEAAEGMENLASAGFSTSEIIAAMPGMLGLAASSGEDLASSADIAASTLRGFGLEASSAGHVADVLAKNAAATNAAVADTGEAMKYVAPVAKSMGIEFEETAAAIGIMADAGIKGSQAGTTLRGALSRIAKPTKAMQETMDSLGLSFYDSNGKMKSLADITEMLETKMAGLTDEQKNQALITLFGQESLSGMMALMDRGSGEVRKLTDEYKNCDGSAKDMAKTMQDNLSGAVEEFGGSVESLGIEIFENIEGPLKKAVRSGTTELNKLTKAVKNNKIEEIVPEEAVNTVQNLGKIAGTVAKGGIKTLGVATGTLAENLDVLIPLTTAYFGAMGAYKVFQQASKGVKTLTVAYQGLQAMEKANAITLVAQQGGLTGLQTVMGVLTGKVSAATAATGLFNKACTLAGGPVGLAVIAIGALTAGLAAYALSQEHSTSAETKFAAELEKSAEAQKKHTAELENNRKKREEAIKSAAAEGVQAEFLEQKLESLMSVEKKSTGQKQQIETIVKRLNELVPDLGLAYNSEKDKLNKSTEAIKKNISAQKELAIAKAYAKQMESVSEDIVDTEIKLAEATEKQTEAEKRKAEAIKNTQKAKEEYLNSGAVAGSKEEQAWKKAQQEQNKAEGNYKRATDSVNKYQGELDKLNGELDELGEAHSNQEAFATFKQNLDDLAKEAGMKASEIPKSIGEGIKNGIYAVPQTGEELKQLISLDELRSSVEKQSKETGVAIPKNLSEGIASGEISFKDAITQMNRLSDFQDAVKKAKIDGKDITDSLAEGIASGKYSVPKSTEELKRLIEFDSLATEAGDTGINIPKNISQGILSGKYDVPKSVDQLQSLIKFDGLSSKATEAGVSIPKGVSQGILSGKYAVPNSVSELQTLIKFDSMATKMQKQGFEIPQALASGISSGKINAVEACKLLMQAGIDGMNSKTGASKRAGSNNAKSANSGFLGWLNTFNKTGQSGGSNFANGLNNKKGSSKSAGSAHASSAESGYKSKLGSMKKDGQSGGSNFATGMNLKKSASKKAAENNARSAEAGYKSRIKNLNSAGKSGGQAANSGASSQKSKFRSTGSDFADGIISGIEAMGGALYSAGAWIAEHVLGATRKESKTHSPSRKFRDEVGIWMPLGVCAGIYSEQKALNRAGVDMVTGILDAAKKTNIAEQGGQIGQSFSESLTREISKIDLTPELRAMAKKFADTKLNLPVLNVEMRSAMESQLNRIATSKQGKIYQIVQSISNPEQSAGNTELFDYDRFERIQRRVAKEQSNRPIYLGTERIDKPLPEGAVPRI